MVDLDIATVDWLHVARRGFLCDGTFLSVLLPLIVRPSYLVS